jgi:signal transduction histidine kinase/ActR/RegA family two-component response regulator
VFGTLTFRHRIVLLVGVAAVALVAVTAVTLVLGRRNELQVSAVRTQYLPLLELDRELKEIYAQLCRVLKDSAEAGEEMGLAQADVLRDKMVRRIDAGAEAIRDNGGDPAALEAELGAYYARASGVLAEILAGAMASQLADQRDAMQRAQQAFEAHLDKAVTPDRDRLTVAFEAARSSQHTALAIDIAVASIAMLVMALWSMRIIRSTVRALREVALAMERLGRGELYRAIEVTTRDELGDLAQEANRTAVQLNAAREALEDKAAELARASRYKTEFLANMSHELRTPLNSIMILSKVLGENEPGTLTPRQVEFANLIHRSGQELLALINEVLDLAKVEAGKQEIVCEAVAVAELASYARQMFQPLAMQKQLDLTVEVDDDAPAYIRTDQARLAQILKNLLANAFKFTERGGVTMRIARPGPGDGGDLVAISVTDTGIGISADKQAWIFEAFAQADGGTSRKYGGTGLGLTIARQLAVRLGGDLGVESQLGAGSTFRVVLPVCGPAVDDTGQPVAPSTAPVTAPVPVPSERGDKPPTLPPMNAVRDPVLAGKLVLIVDDDMRNVYSLSSALRAEHLAVLTASDGQEAIDELEQHPEVDVVLMDVMMPHMNGYEATRRIRTQERFARLPIIALTANSVPGEREHFLEAGASDYVPKPIEPGRLVELIRRSLDQRGIVK